ncbi:hypothetical protein B0T19DRAFT_196570 [Cercophora scortea]|uniref:Glycosyl transferase family 25 domain-containing protein n=1 Tax=Cercophora scortea TaxID=314031 RepID=A0AAE0IP65_9PEZI|nr:hypothetical protein B0T19DRAFT_196570 [Cercophora scortea]
MAGAGDYLGSLFAQGRSYRHLHRVLLAAFILVTIFVLDRYRTALAGTFGMTEPVVVEVVEEVPVVSPTPGKAEEDLSIERAGNSTLGFHAIYYINMQARYDREDAMALQAYISGLDIQDFPAVEADMIDPIGMPPSHRPRKLKTGEKGCWRAHANIWSEMVRTKSPPVLIMESDATWDINLRPIMSHLNKHFVDFLRRINSTAVHDPSWGAKNNAALPRRDTVIDPTHVPADNTTSNSNSTAPPLPTINYNPDDPWLSEHWDLFSVGQCFEHPQDKDINLIFPDPWVPEGRSYFGQKLGNERVVRKSGGITCTTSYAISHTGAAKLLMRSALDLDNPVDLLIRRLTLSRDLVAYSVMPPVIAQWEYRGDVGMTERGSQSDINGGKHVDTPENANMKGWDEAVPEKNSVWTTKAHHRDVTFEKMALDVAWSEILGDAQLKKSWWDPKSGD